MHKIATFTIAAMMAFFSSIACAELDLLGIEQIDTTRAQAAGAQAQLLHNNPQFDPSQEARKPRISGVDPRLKSASEEIEAFLSRLPHIIWAQIEAIRKYGLAAMFADESPMIEGAREAGIHLGRGIGQIAQAVAQDMTRTARSN